MAFLCSSLGNEKRSNLMHPDQRQSTAPVVSRRSFLATVPVITMQGGSRPLVIDAHCHAGTGEAMSAPWSTRADPEITLRHMAEAGIDRTIIFPINNNEYER